MLYPRNGKQSEDAARHDALFEKGDTQQVRLFVSSVIYFIGNYTVQLFREKMIAAARSARFAVRIELKGHRPHINSTGRPLRTSQRGCMRARSTCSALLDAASAFFRPAPAPALPARAAADNLSEMADVFNSRLDEMVIDERADAEELEAFIDALSEPPSIRPPPPT